MKMQRAKDLVTGAIISALVVGITPVALAKTGAANIPVKYSNIKVVVDGKELSTSKEPFIYDGTTYLPLRAVAEAVGKEVSWDNAAKVAYLGAKTEETSPQAAKETLVYKDERVIIHFTGIGDRGVEFKVQNLTDINITIQADSVSINGISTNDITMSDNVAPKSTGKVVAKCKDFSKYTEVKTVGGQLRVIDFERSFDSYNATFSNVSV